jgi:2-oxoglutarate ferredoxin oxidoreductase subunit alpha
VYFGSTQEAMLEALHLLEEQNIFLDSLRIRAFPFSSEIQSCLANYKTLFIVEQNRDGQMKTLLRGELDLKMNIESLVFFDGLPLLADKISNSIASRLSQIDSSC